MRVEFAKLKSIDGGRAVVTLESPGGQSDVEVVVLSPCGVNGPGVWFPQSVGDVVCVLLDELRPENSVLIGCVFTNSQKPVKTGADEAAIKAGKVFIGSDVSDCKPCPRDDLVQSELSKIKSELDALASDFNTHLHTSTPSGGTTTKPQNASQAPVVHTNSYSVQDTASDSVMVK